MQPRTLWVKRDAGEATPAGWFLAYVIESPFCGGFLVLTTFVVEPTVYNFMQTQKERKPCKIKASAINKKSARRRTRSGDLGLRGPERSVDIELSSAAGLEKKNDTDLVSFFFQARDGDRTRDPLLGKEVLHR